MSTPETTLSLELKLLENGKKSFDLRYKMLLDGIKASAKEAIKEANPAEKATKLADLAKTCVAITAKMDEFDFEAAN